MLRSHRRNLQDNNNNNAVGRQRNLGLDTRIHWRHSEYDQLRIFYLLFSYKTIQICQFRCFEIKNKPYQSLFFLNKHYLLLFVITALLSECLLLSEALHKQNKKNWYASIDTILKYLKINVSAKSILTTKRNIKSYFYSKLKLKFLMTDMESNMEINCAHIDFSKIILHLNLILI